MYSLKLSPFFFIFLMSFCLIKCNGVEGELSSLYPQQTYSCDFHDRPLILTGWRGKVSVRKYTMKDPSRGTVIRGIARYAQHCEALPLQWEEGAKEKVNLLNEETDWWALLGFISFILIFVSGMLVNIFEDHFKKLELEKEEEERKKRLEEMRQKEEERMKRRKEERMKREKEIEEERARSKRAHLERLERKAAKRKLYEANRLKNLEKRKKSQ